MSCKNGFSLYSSSLFNNISQSVPSNLDIKYGSGSVSNVGPDSAVEVIEKY